VDQEIGGFDADTDHPCQEANHGVRSCFWCAFEARNAHVRDVAEQSRLINRMKSTEGEALPPNTLAELRRDLERRAFICEQIQNIETERWSASASAASTRS
jgi:hypothetical protein